MMTLIFHEGMLNFVFSISQKAYGRFAKINSMKTKIGFRKL